MSKQNRQLLVLICVGLSLIVALYIFGDKRRIEAGSGYRLTMGTFAHLKAIAKDPQTAKKCVETAFAELKKVDELMSDYKIDSQISLVNSNAAKTPVKVGESTFEVFRKASSIAGFPEVHLISQSHRSPNSGAPRQNPIPSLQKKSSPMHARK